MGLHTTLFILLIVTFVFSAFGTPIPGARITEDVYGDHLQVNHV